MSDLADSVTAGGHVPERFRAELLLQLPTAALREKGYAERDYDEQQGTLVADPDYNPEALAAWILQNVSEAYAAGVVDGESGAIVQSAAEIGTAAGRLEIMADVVPYLEQVAAALKQGHSLASQWDLARTIGAQADSMRTAATALIAKYPALRDVI